MRNPAPEKFLAADYFLDYRVGEHEASYFVFDIRRTYIFCLPGRHALRCFGFELIITLYDGCARRFLPVATLGSFIYSKLTARYQTNTTASGMPGTKIRIGIKSPISLLF